MTITPERYMYNPVDAIRVTDENIEQVAAWCQGEVKTYQGSFIGIKSESYGRRYIDVKVNHPTGRHTAKAFAGDWIVSVKDAFKVYNHRAFENTFKDFPHNEDILLVLTMMTSKVMQLAFSEETPDDEKTAELIRIVEASSSNILDLL